jgi:hypothetical protein
MVTADPQQRDADASSNTSMERVQFPARQDGHDCLRAVSERDRTPLIVAVMLLIVLAWVGAAVIWGVKGLLGVALLLVPTMGCLIILITMTR